MFQNFSVSVIYCTLIRYNIKYFQSQVAKQPFCNAAIAVSFQSYGGKDRKTGRWTDRRGATYNVWGLCNNNKTLKDVKLTTVGEKTRKYSSEKQTTEPQWTLSGTPASQLYDSQIHANVLFEKSKLEIQRHWIIICAPQCSHLEIHPSSCPHLTPAKNSW